MSLHTTSESSLVSTAKTDSGDPHLNITQVSLHFRTTMY